MLIHGRLDLSCPVETSWELAGAWPHAELITPADAGHLGSESKRQALLGALDKFAGSSGGHSSALLQLGAAGGGRPGLAAIVAFVNGDG
ncbi:MAG: hypothetical protein ACLQDY_09105 [Streptosporangiaceae bacterium]